MALPCTRAWRKCLTVLGLGLLGLAGPRPAEGGVFHYAMVFGADAHPRKARTAHTWAIFVRAMGEGPDPSAYAVETRVISWLPTTRVVHLYDLRPEPGHNLSIADTFATVLQYEDRPTVWGPFLIDAEHFARADRVAASLESGAVRYRAFFPRDPDITNCIHAVANVDDLFGREIRPGFRYGKPASKLIAEHVAAQALPDPAGVGGSRHLWLVPRLGLDRYPLDVVPAPF